MRAETKMKCLIIATLGLFLLCSTAQAISYSYSYTFSGTVTGMVPLPAALSLPNDLIDFFTPGTSFTGTLQYEYSTPPPHFPALDEDPTVAYYYPDYHGFSASYSILVGESLAVNGNSNVDIFTIRNGAIDALEIVDTEGVSGAFADYYLFGDAGLYFYDDSGTIFSSNLLENLPILDGSSFDRTELFVDFYDTGFADHVGLRGVINDINNNPTDDDANHTPEPATMVLFGFGLVGLGITRRKLLKKR